MPFFSITARGRDPNIPNPLLADRVKPDITNSLNTGITRREYPHTQGEEKPGISLNDRERGSTHCSGVQQSGSLGPGLLRGMRVPRSTARETDYQSPAETLRDERILPALFDPQYPDTRVGLFINMYLHGLRRIHSGVLLTITYNGAAWQPHVRTW